VSSHPGGPPLRYLHLYGTKANRGGPQGSLYLYDAPLGDTTAPRLLLSLSASRWQALALLTVLRRLTAVTGVPVTAKGPLFETER
jgi:hypothetical protein